MEEAIKRVVLKIGLKRSKKTLTRKKERSHSENKRGKISCGLPMQVSLCFLVRAEAQLLLQPTLKPVTIRAQPTEGSPNWHIIRITSHSLLRNIQH